MGGPPKKRYPVSRTRVILSASGLNVFSGTVAVGLPLDAFEPSSTLGSMVVSSGSRTTEGAQIRSPKWVWLLLSASWSKYFQWVANFILFCLRGRGASVAFR